MDWSRPSQAKPSCLTIQLSSSWPALLFKVGQGNYLQTTHWPAYLALIGGKGGVCLTLPPHTQAWQEAVCVFVCSVTQCSAIVSCCSSAAPSLCVYHSGGPLFLPFPPASRTRQPSSVPLLPACLSLIVCYTHRRVTDVQATASPGKELRSFNTICTFAPQLRLKAQTDRYTWNHGKYRFISAAILRGENSKTDTGATP